MPTSTQGFPLSAVEKNSSSAPFFLVLSESILIIFDLLNLLVIISSIFSVPSPIKEMSLELHEKQLL